MPRRISCQRLRTDELAVPVQRIQVENGSPSDCSEVSHSFPLLPQERMERGQACCRIRARVRIGNPGYLSSLVHRKRECIVSSAKRSEILHPIVLVPQERASLCAVGGSAEDVI